MSVKNEMTLVFYVKKKLGFTASNKFLLVKLGTALIHLSDLTYLGAHLSEQFLSEENSKKSSILNNNIIV